MRSSRALFPILAVILATGTPSAHSALPTPEEWAGESNIAGVELVFEETGLSETDDGHLLATHKVRLSGVPPDLLYELWMRKMDGSVRSDSMLVRAGEDHALLREPGGAEISIAFSDMMAGEPVSFLLRSEDGQHRIVQSYVPFPLEAHGSGACKLRLEMASDSLYVGHLSGFEPGQELRAESHSEEETLEFTVTIPEDGGHVVIVLAPEVIGVDGGWADLTLIGRSCTVSIEYPWGAAARPL